MKIYSIRQKQCLPILLDEAWSFFSDPKNLQEITPPEMRFQILSDVPDEIYPGLIIQYKVTAIAKISMNWTTEIAHVIPGKMFIDEQRFGPYNFWHHQHHFRAIENGTEMVDFVHYALAFGLLGRMVNAIDIRRRLNHIFAYRKQVLEQMFGRIENTHAEAPNQEKVFEKRAQ